MIDFFKKQLFTVHQNGKQQVSEVFKYIGPGIIVTVGFIDPGNWAANLAAGASFGYELLWVVTLSTIMLILLQHNVAHLGIVRGQCLSECAYEFLPRYVSCFVLSTAGIAAAATALAEFIGAAIALKMLFGIPILIGSILTALICTVMLITNSYRKLERIIAGFVSLIALAYLVEVNLVNVDWVAAGIGWVDPKIPNESMLVILSILGAVIMPHNLFLHSEIIQSRQFNTQDHSVMKRQLRYEFLDTLLSMGIGWMINSAMILLAAAVFFAHGIEVTELEQAEELLRPLIGPAAGTIFAIALLFAGFASSATAGMAGASIFAGMFGESYDMKDFHTRLGLALTYIPALLLIVFVTDSFQALLISQMFLSLQLPITIFLQLYMTSSRKVMGQYANHTYTNVLLWGIGIVVTVMNIYLLIVG
ncbi:MAG: Nramp family divalent metal transporter [Veillonella sp.]|uniref:Nramp family divalent metal transporter n=1 Tax=Veillonella sp. TaxID=1926307 RepID=UPI0025DD4188|nr:Nramp family divalent metal transporter [Veillonella sp.]MBS5337287.1 Nramp family divalent metal transporter [Veillonella sp.]